MQLKKICGFHYIFLLFHLFNITGYFLTDVEAKDGDVFALYFFQMSFATTATTIVSGAMAERTHLNAYTIFSFTNTISYCFPAHWIWGEKGFLKELGVIDFAGISFLFKKKILYFTRA